MLYRAPLHLFLFVLTAAVAVNAQSATGKPLTKSEIFIALEAARSSDELVRSTNNELIEEIAERGIDFVLTPEEEWSLQLRDASDELLAAIRVAVNPAEREFRLNVRRQQNLYSTFAASFAREDLASRQTALSAAREFLQLYSTDPNVAEIVTFMQRNMSRMQQNVAMLQQRQEATERARAQTLDREQRREQQRAERDRQRQEAAANHNTRADRSAPAVSPTPTTKNETKSTQPSDNPRPVFPITRRP